jgi:hypothetical protein
MSASTSDLMVTGGGRDVPYCYNIVALQDQTIGAIRRNFERLKRAELNEAKSFG